ncbi:NlpC/P60 family protein [Clostridium sp. LY3-2]|uniref:phage tail spike protein n=1 Tax=Clostridium sp. LY3-2 TaxID=2942482 RepID=UPI0021526E4B|nr:phage tail spike protein [Clostridium sp. LY3-2]MCR6515799.1 NlpC/P60 family protein [Clostridium sp. LY3-2]
MKPTYCILTMELLTGLNSIELKHPYDKDGRWRLIEKDSVVSVPTPYINIPDQLYRIYSIEKDDDELTVRARHIFYDLIDTIIKDYDNKDNIFDVRCVNCNGQQALNKIFRNTGFSASSNILELNTSYFYCKNIIEALSGEENSFLSRWGGELFLNNFNISINYKVGMDNGVTISYGRNLQGLLEEISWESVVTRIIPIGFDGIMLSGNKPWVDSPLIKKYSHVYEKPIKFENIKLKGTQNNSGDDAEGFDTIEEARAELIKCCENEFAKGIDKPLVNYKVDFLDLSKLDEFKDYKILTELLLGDEVSIKHKLLNIDLKARLIKFEYNVLDEKMETLELGSYLTTLSEEEANSSINIDNLKSSFDGEGYLKGSSIKGIIDALKAPVVAQKTVAKKLDSVAWKMEVLDPDDPNFGCMQAGTKGLLLADKRTPDNRDWDYTTAITPRGIVADTIVTGILTSVVIQNATGSSYWNLDTGDFCLNGGRIIGKNENFEMDLKQDGELTFKNNGQKAIKIHNNSIDLFNWKKDSDYIGGLKAFILGDDADKPFVGLANDFDSAVGISYPKDNGMFGQYIIFDKYNAMKDSAVAPIKILENVEMNHYNLYNPVIKADKTVPIYANGKKVADFTDKAIFLYSNDKLVAQLQDNGLWLHVPILNKHGNTVLDPDAPQGETTDGSDELRNKVVNSARKLIGKWYVWGGNYPPLGTDSGTDCSGLMQFAYNDNGIKISRTTYTQIKEGTEVSEGDLKPGDLVFPSTEHVFMYSGESNGRHMCVEAAHTGTQIRERAFSWGSGYRARRIIKESSSGGGGSVGGSAESKASANILYYVKGIEGFGPNYYYDSVGVRTLGYGMTGGELNGIRVPISEASATHYLTKFFNRDYYEQVLRIVKSKGVKNPKQREIDAFASFAYNLGVPAFSDSTLLKKYVAGERGEAIHEQFKRWVHAGGSVHAGLVRRREEEWKIFSNSGHVAGYDGRPYIEIINGGGSVTSNGGYGASPY